MKTIVLALIFIVACLGFVVFMCWIIRAIDKAFDEKDAAMRKFYRAAGEANTAARTAGKSTTTFFKEH